MPDPLALRTDLRAPVLVLESEFDVLRSWQARQPDSERFRLWEVAGSTHQDEYVERTLRAQFARDLGQRLPGCDCAVNDMPFHDVENAALAHLRNWAGGGAAAPEYPRIEMRDGDVVRDEHGNARGGIRLPQLEAPLAQYGPVGTPEFCALRGFVKPFERDLVVDLYGDGADLSPTIRRRDHGRGGRGLPARNGCARGARDRRARDRRAPHQLRKRPPFTLHT